MIEDKIKRAVVWIEDNIDNQILYDDPAKIACLSEYHFRRLFKSITGISPGIYIVRRRLTLSLDKLRNTNDRIIDVAFDSGFESHEAFSRAFKNMFSLTPSEYRLNRPDASNMTQPPIDDALFNHLTNGKITMQPKIIQQDSFDIIGMGADFELGQTWDINALWNRFNKREQEITGVENTFSYGICHAPLIGGRPDRHFHYTCGLKAKDETPVPEGMERVRLPGASYAVFTHKGHIQDLENTQNYIWKIWLPKSGYELANQPDFERYEHGKFDPEMLEGEIEIWVPVV